MYGEQMIVRCDILLAHRSTNEFELLVSMPGNISHKFGHEVETDIEKQKNVLWARQKPVLISMISLIILLFRYYKVSMVIDIGILKCVFKTVWMDDIVNLSSCLSLLLSATGGRRHRVTQFWHIKYFRWEVEKIFVFVYYWGWTAGRGGRRKKSFTVIISIIIP